MGQAGGYDQDIYGGGSGFVESIGGGGEGDEPERDEGRRNFNARQAMIDDVRGQGEEVGPRRVVAAPAPPPLRCMFPVFPPCPSVPDAFQARPSMPAVSSQTSPPPPPHPCAIMATAG